MARKPNHAWERRQRELAKQAKREAKLERKRLAKAAKAGNAAGDAEPTESQDDSEA